MRKALILFLLFIFTGPIVSKTYYTGKRGGCYYINASGKKVYVDKRYCKL